jgi:tetratricopeptide (TPR) repeat protein
MRIAITILAFVVASSQLLADFKPGDIVVVTREADLKVNNKTVGTVRPGFSLAVGKLEGNWLWVSDGVPGWLKVSSVAPLDEAIAYFTETIRKDPRNERSYAARAMALTEKKQYDQAINDYSTAIRLNRGEASYYGSRGWTYLRKSDFERALQDCSRAIEFGLNTPANYNNRVWAFAGKGDYAKAIADYSTAMRLDPTLAYPIENLAEVFACCPQDRFRDGKKAVTFATRVCEMSRWLQPSHLHLLAAASAENGQFEDAVRWEEKALELTPPTKENNRKAFEKALGRFKERQPFHEMVSIE